ncbi:MAG: hypothetical protein ACYC4L_18270 [Chloroflexota bacterium]
MAESVLARTRVPRLPALLRALSRNDVRLFGRDTFLPTLVGFALGAALLLRFGLPWLAGQAELVSGLPVDVVALFPALMGYMVLLQGALLGGAVIAFIVLDERDDHTIEALLVTPLPTAYYLGYRVAAATVLAFGLVLAQFYIVGVALVPFWQLVPIVAVGALMGALTELMLVVFAGNKIEGFAQLKIVASSGVVLFAAWFLPPPWDWLVGLYPPFWAVKAYWLAHAGDPNWWLALLVGLVYMLAVVAYLLRRFDRVVHRQ